MRRFLSRAAAALCLAGVALSAPAIAQQAAQGQAAGQPNRVLKETHGDWEIHCIEGTETCVMQQFGETSDGKRALLVMVERLTGATAEGKDVPATLTALAPLGVLIPYGIRVKVDQGEVYPVPLMRCFSDRCFAQAPLLEEDVGMFKGGSTARFGFFLTEEVLVDISLNGFTAAFNALKPVQVQTQQN